MTEEPNVDYTIEEDGGVVEQVDDVIFETKEKKPKRKRMPMSEERKENLRNQLRLARERKKNLKEESIDTKEPIKIDTSPNETDTLKKELAEMKKAKLEEARIKLEKKESAAAKRKATKERKALEKKMAEVAPPPVVERPKPKPKKVEFTTEIEPTAPRYTTYKKSIWSDFM